MINIRFEDHLCSLFKFFLPKASILQNVLVTDQAKESYSDHVGPSKDNHGK